MRFSSLFQFPAAQPVPARAEAAPPAPATTAPTPLPQVEDLPDDLDQRVRMIGEWQLGEG